MSRPEPEREEKPAGPGPGARWALRIVDAGIVRLQHLHARLAGVEEGTRDGPHAAKHGHEVQHEDTTASVPKAPSMLRRLALWALLIAIGAGAGTFSAYQGFAHLLTRQAGTVERMQEEVEAVRAEDSRTTRLLDKFQRENADYRRDTREAQRELDTANRRIGELEAEVAGLKLKAERRELEVDQQLRRAAAGRPLAAPKPQAQKSARCAAGSADDVSTCIENFNQ